MCRRCDEGDPQDHSARASSRRDFLKVSTATAATGMLAFDVDHLRRQLEASRDRIFAAAGIPQGVFLQ